jgi:hypothetical protein
VLGLRKSCEAISVRVSLGHEASDLGLLRRQVDERLHRPLASVLPGRLEFDARSLEERFHSEVREHLVRRSTLFPSLDPASLPAALTSPFGGTHQRWRPAMRL